MILMVWNSEQFSVKTVLSIETLNLRVSIESRLSVRPVKQSNVQTLVAGER